MSVVISDETLQAARLSADELKGGTGADAPSAGPAHYGSGQPAIPIHYGEAEFEADLKVINAIAHNGDSACRTS